VCGQGGLVAPQMAIGCVISRLQYWPNKGLVAYLYSKRRGGIYVHCWLLPGVVFSLSMAFSSPSLSDPHGDRYWRIFFLSRNVSERDPTSVLFVQDNVDEKRVEWREKESSLWKIGSKRFVMLANRHPYILTSFHLPLFRYRLSIQSLTDRVVERVIEWNSVERRLLCAGVVETTNQPRVSLSSLFSLSRLYPNRW
jgi:hypothetical protein